MSSTRTISINGTPHTVAPRVSVAAALLNAGHTSFRSSVSGEPRAPLCGMGVCQECLVTIDGTPHLRSCMIECRDGMRIETARA